MLNRRRFIRHVLLAGGALSVSLSGSLAAKTSKLDPFEKLVRNILVTDLKGLKVNITDIEEYAREVSRNNLLGAGFTHLFGLYQVFGVKRLPLPFNNRYSQLRTDITSNFLFSTDFFQNKMDDQKIIKYSGSIHQPYKGACSNPFSGLFYNSSR